MGKTTGISWTDSTLNIMEGCTEKSPGCDNCYAKGVAARFAQPKQDGSPGYYNGLAFFDDAGEPQWTGKLRYVRERLDQVIRWRNSAMIFVESMGDVFHEDADYEFLYEAFTFFRRADWHVIQLLTKRVDNMVRFLEWEQNKRGEATPSHIWPGFSVENQYLAGLRIRIALRSSLPFFWLSAEPLIENIEWNPAWFEDGRLGWVVFGGESGLHARDCDEEWIRSGIRSWREYAPDKPVFVKQMGKLWSARHGAKLQQAQKDAKGGDWTEWPEDLRVREFPDLPPNFHPAPVKLKAAR